MKKINAIILAAGFGTRLKPITETVPKPLVRICNHPLLDNITANLRSAGVEEFAVNTHYLADKIEDYIKASPSGGSFHVFYEPEILGTGGPLVNAKKLLLKGDCFILHNGDILTDMNIPALVEEHLKSGNIATMALVDGPENKVCVSPDGIIFDILDRLQGDTRQGARKLTYCGITVFSKQIFEYLPEKPVNCSIIKAITRAIDTDPGSVKGYIQENIYWNDLGTVSQYFKAHEDILLKKALLPKAGDFSSSASIIKGENSFIAEDAEISGFLVMGKNCRIDAGASVCNCILFDNAVVKSGDFRYNEIIAENFSLHRHIQTLRELKIIKKLKLQNYQISSLVEQGSDRGFYRLKNKKGSRVLMLSSEMDEDFGRYIGIGRFLKGLNLQTPEIYEYRNDEYSVLMEDLGNQTIYKVVNDKNKNTDFEYLYRKIIDNLLEFQLKATDALNKSPQFHVRVFDYYYLRWETSYFRKNFFENYCGLTHEETEGLEDELHRLADSVFKHPQIFMHRDFQSQNILLQDDGRIRFVDFQGSRKGPLAYDLMSLVKDPYVDISRETRASLIKYFFEKFNECGGREILSFSPEDVARPPEYFTITAGLQRNMQALGAYTFLSLKKNKMKYQQYIPLAFKYLTEGLEEFKAIENMAGFSLGKLSSICADMRRKVLK
ncbi:MAG: hypothetical protein A2017_07975 [Lentisphaerae bacterium GWF2_44_16]|nr:MAG: hypothetical protein A2017_07975 [Lentisphaerae bacterium GWF2_44_16]